MATPIKVQGYGWRPSLPDQRDYKFSAPDGVQLPPQLSLRDKCPAVWDQGQLGSCTAHAVGAAQIVEAKKQGIVEYMPARLFIYYNSRSLEGTVKQDSGAQLRDAVKAVATWGAPPESMCPYNITKFRAKPAKRTYQVGMKDLALKYMSVPQDVQQIKGRLAQGFPVIIGFTVYQSFETPTVAQTGVVPMPAPNEQVLGGHAVLVVGWDDTKNAWEVRNSWGEGWGDHGYMWMPYGYLTDPNLSGDFWTIEQVEA